MGITNPRETAWRDTSRKGLASSVPRSNSVRIVAKLMIRKSETTRLEIVSRVRRLFRRTFLKISFAYFICVHLRRAELGAGQLAAIGSVYALAAKRFTCKSNENSQNRQLFILGLV